MLARTMCALSCARATPLSATAKKASATILQRVFMSRSYCHHWPRLQGWVRGVYNDGRSVIRMRTRGVSGVEGQKGRALLDEVRKRLELLRKLSEAKNLLWLYVRIVT